MKQVVCIVTLWSLLAACPVARAQSYESLWKQVEQAQKKDLPKSVVRIAEQIAARAERERNVPQLWKALLCRNAYTERITPDSLRTHVARWEQWAERETDPRHAAVLHAIVAGAHPNSEQVEKHLQASLQPEELLLNTASTAYRPVVELGEQSSYYGHDLYHLLARKAIESYRKLDSERSRAATDSLYRRMEELYTQRKGGEEAALWTAIEAWKWRQTKYGPQEQEESLKQLDTLMARYGQWKLCAEVWLAKAEWMANRTEAKDDEEAARHTQEALALCDEALSRYPRYRRVAAIRNLRARLLQPELHISLPESAYPGDSLKGTVRMANIGGATLHLYRTAYAEWPTDERGNFLQAEKLKRGTQVSTIRIEALPPQGAMTYPLATRQTFSWGQLAPDAPGVYVVEAVPDRPARDGKKQYGVLTVSRLKTLSIELPGQQVELAVVDGRSGHPVAGASVIFYQKKEPHARKPIAEGKTGADGRVTLPASAWNLWVQVRVEGDVADRELPVSRWPHPTPETERMVSRMALLTDRSLYRPGQSVRVKGIAYEQNLRQAQVLVGQRYTLRLLDVNRQEVASQEVTTGEFGSFTHSFTLPTTGLNGLYHIEVKELSATTSIRVEAYKRPTFELKLLPVSEAYRLGDTVRVRGVATAYNGTAVQHARVVTRLTLTPRFIDFRRRWEETPLRSDTVEVDAEGHFSVVCPLTLPQGEMVGVPTERPWMYRLEVTVVDEAGESHTATHTWEASEKTYLFDPQLPDLLYKEEGLHNLCFRISNREQVAQCPKARYRLYSQSPRQECVKEAPFMPNQPTDCTAWSELPSGAYRLQFIVTDSSGREEESESYPFTLMSRHDVRPAVFTPLFVREETLAFDAEHPARFEIGTSLKEVYLMWTEVDDGGAIRRGCRYLSDTIVHWEVPYRESMGKGGTWSFAFVKEGQCYTHCVTLKRRQPERRLQWRWESFRDRLTPGKEEEWQLVLTDEQGAPAAAELLATLYDASLDQIYYRPQRLQPSYPIYLRPHWWQEGWKASMSFYFDFPRRWWKEPTIRFDRLVSYSLPMQLARAEGIRYKTMASAASTRVNASMQMNSKDAVVFEEEVAAGEEEMEQPEVAWRKELAETAFFYPHLRTDSLGRAVFSFRVPESLTRWNFRGYAHTRRMETARMEASVVTAKEWMVTPHLPRFVRAGDSTELSATVANQTSHRVEGVATLTLFDPISDKKWQTQRVKFSCEPQASCVVRFPVQLSGKQELVGIRMVAEGEGFSDGEQHLLPVLTQSQWMTEALPLQVRGRESKVYSLDSLFNHHNPAATARRLTLELTGNPAWLAVQALPDLSCPGERADAMSWAAAYYAGQLGAYMVASQPRIETLLKAWQLKQSEGKEPGNRLKQNEELKDILLEESPWVLAAQHEAERQARLTALFDPNRVKQQERTALEKLKALQGADGSWSWYPGMRGNRYVTAYVTELLLRLPLLTGQSLAGEARLMQQKGMAYLQREVEESCRQKRKATDPPFVGTDLARTYLYLKALEGSSPTLTEQEKLLDGLEKLSPTASMREKAENAYILWKNGRKQAARRVLASLREHLVQEEETGAHFAFLDRPYAWGMQPIPTQVRALEALHLTGEDEALVEEMKLWLLKQKQTRTWGNPTATADAVYALLCGGYDLLAAQGDATVTLGKRQLHSTEAEIPGLNYLQVNYPADDPACKARQVRIEKHDEGVAWGAVYAQYRLPLSEVTEQGGALAVEKRYYVERMDGHGKQTLQALTPDTPLQVGDKVIVRFTLRLDRAMDFLQLKEGHAACLEPIGSLSGYTWEHRLAYYVDRKDASTHFFIDHLGKGSYTVEYACRVTRAGRYQGGVATLQSAYAPEYAAHSATQILQVE